MIRQFATLSESEATLDESISPAAALAQLQREHYRLLAALDTLTSGLVITDPHQPDHPIIFVNPGFTRMTGYTEDDVIGKNCRFLQGVDTDPATIQVLRDAIKAQQSATVQMLNYRKDGSTFWNELTIDPIFDADGRLINFVGLQNDVTARKQAEDDRARMQAEMLAIQSAVLAELSTPLLPISDHVIVMPLVGTIDEQRSQRIVDTLLSGVQTHRARVAIVDITGVPTVDTAVANVLIQAAQAVRLLGAEPIITGVRPEVAQTLVMLGVDLRSITVRGTLQNGIAQALS